ncbi:phage major capsid protein [Neobacillus ginsengisoli]|uniref:HK97 family phage major capsid protein n=1 Tax=Neobacillus ginsengisoli TaxID=904295 RepID=A0ABT9XQZ2_9BACI|nr:phage major capsid protein [Neobacillus ginsengisoli]MDQ0197949.1 HK97 family phage major capsid protein [Neobacillus ginsengisoli]
MGNEKMLTELRFDLVDEMEKLVSDAKNEKRSLSGAEVKHFDHLKERIAEIDLQLQTKEKEDRGAEGIVTKEIENMDKQAEQRALDEKAFLTLIKENRATGGMLTGGNGVMIPTSIANRIVESAYNVSPLLQLATKWNVKENLVLPIYDYMQNTFSYFTEGNTIADVNGNFTNITLANFIVGHLTKISNSLINRADIDVVSIIINNIGLSLARFLENELINETGAKLRGLKTGVTAMTTGATTMVITPAELVKVQMAVPQILQGNAKWLMHPGTYAYLRGLTASTGQLLMNGDDAGLSADPGFMLLGKEVILSDNMPQMGVGAREIYYGDFSGLDIKMTTDIQVKVLLERFADMYQTGISCFIELDSQVGNIYKLAGYIGK